MNKQIEIDIDIRHCPAVWQNFVQHQRTLAPEVAETEFITMCLDHLLNEYKAIIVEIPLDQLTLEDDGDSCHGGNLVFADDEKYKLFMTRYA